MTDTGEVQHRPIADLVIDAGEASCGDLLIRIVRAIPMLPAGTVIEVVAYSRSALHDIPAWCRMTRNPLLHVDATRPAHFFIQKGENKDG